MNAIIHPIHLRCNFQHRSADRFCERRRASLAARGDRYLRLRVYCRRFKQIDICAQRDRQSLEMLGARQVLETAAPSGGDPGARSDRAVDSWMAS